jgi:glycosyltransferase involved in cell wall biosynthesis
MTIDLSGNAGKFVVTPMVSVVVPTYNRANLLRATVESILQQTYTDFELIIVDNMSRDGTENYVANLRDQRVRYFRNDNGGVIAINRNFGIRKAKGTYVALCDDDDLWYPEKLEKQVRAMASDLSAGLCYSNALSFNTNGTVKEWYMRRKATENHFWHLLIGNLIPSSSVLIRKDVFERVGLLSEMPVRVGVEDYEMWIRISHAYKLLYLPEMLIRYRMHGSNLTNSMTRQAWKALLVLMAIKKKYNLGAFAVLPALISKTLHLVAYFLLRR